jgi:hypothetical protein
MDDVFVMVWGAVLLCGSDRHNVWISAFARDGRSGNTRAFGRA